jgi:hypothetical protein
MREGGCYYKVKKVSPFLIRGYIEYNKEKETFLPNTLIVLLF